MRPRLTRAVFATVCGHRAHPDPYGLGPRRHQRRGKSLVLLYPPRISNPHFLLVCLPWCMVPMPASRSSFSEFFSTAVVMVLHLPALPRAPYTARPFHSRPMPLSLGWADDVEHPFCVFLRVPAGFHYCQMNRPSAPFRPAGTRPPEFRARTPRSSSTLMSRPPLLGVRALRYGMFVT